MFDVTSYRKLFPMAEKYAFFNHAGVSALNTHAADAMRAFAEQSTTIPFTEAGLAAFHTMNELRERFATLINARSVDEIVLMPNTAAGINTAALGLPLRTGDNVLVIDGDYPANIYPWMNLAHRGVLTKFVPTHNGGVDLSLLESRIDSHTRVIAMSTVQFATGFRNDVVSAGQLCRDRNIYFAVDGIQSLGAFPLDVQAANIDFLSCGSQKWLLGPMGVGFMYVRRELLDDLIPGPYVGAASTVDWLNFLDYNFSPLPTAERFALGSPNFIGMHGLNASVALLQGVGIDHVSERILSLTDVAINDLRERGYRLSVSTDRAHRSGIVIVEVNDPEATCDQLTKANIITVVRGKGFRIAPHFYNTEEEILRVGAVLDQVSPEL